MVPRSQAIAFGSRVNIGLATSGRVDHASQYVYPASSPVSGVFLRNAANLFVGIRINTELI